MKQLTCEMCGSNDLIKQDGVFVCQSCGCKYSVEEAKKLMVEGTVEVTGIVKVEGINDADKLYENAKCFKDLGETEKAKKSLEELINLYPNNYRGWWGMLELETEDFSKYVLAWNFDFMKYYKYSIKCCDEDSIKKLLIKTYEDWYNKRYNYLCKQKLGYDKDAYNRCKFRALRENEQFYSDGIKNAEKCNKKVGVFKALGFNDEDRVAKGTLGYNSDIYTYTFEKFIFVNGCTAVIEYRTSYEKSITKIIKSVFFSNIVNLNLEKYIGELPDGEAKNEFAKEGCYVATCVYGSYDCPQVWTLRRFRDNTLAETMLGRAFIRTYYAISPTLVKWFGDTSWFKKMWEGTLDRMVSKLQSNGVEDTPYQDRKW